jgi:hypothetical protein
MSEILDKIFQACNPLKSATSEFYVDCREARGGDAFVRTFLENLKRCGTIESGNGKKGDFLYFLFSGHSGCGKSSDLVYLTQKLKTNCFDNTQYFPIYLDVSEYLDDFDVSTTDILLAIVTELAATLKEELDIELQDTYFQGRLSELKEFFLSDVEISEGDIGIFGSKVKVKRLQTNQEGRQKVREALRLKTSSMLTEINLLFEKARREIRKKTCGETSLKYSDIVIILDNLEKIQRFENAAEGLPSHERLFIDNYAQLTALETHIIYTVPLRLVRSHLGKRLSNYYNEPFVLPMVKTFDRKTRKPFEIGVKALQDILQKRFGTVPVTDAFESDALEFLIKYSGGSIRDLIRFVRNSIAQIEQFPIKLTHAKNSLKSNIQIYSTGIPEGHWEKLAQVDLSPDQTFPNDDEDYRDMLANQSLLEYINGGNEDIWEEVAPWYAVNPIVRELRQFKSAKGAIQTAESKLR